MYVHTLNKMQKLSKVQMIYAHFSQNPGNLIIRFKKLHTFEKNAKFLLGGGCLQIVYNAKIPVSLSRLTS